MRYNEQHKKDMNSNGNRRKSIIKVGKNSHINAGADDVVSFVAVGLVNFFLAPMSV